VFGIILKMNYRAIPPTLVMMLYALVYMEINQHKTVFFVFLINLIVILGYRKLCFIDKSSLVPSVLFGIFTYTI